MLAQKDDSIKEAAETVYEISQDRMIQEQIWARQDYYRAQRANKKFYEDQIAERDAALAQKEAMIEQKDAMIEQLDAEIARLQRTIEELSKEQ